MLGKDAPSEEFAKQLKELVAANVAGNARLLTRFNDLVRDATKGLGTPRGESPDATALLSRWLDFNLASYSVVTTHGLALLNGLLSAAENALVPRPPAPAGTPPPARRVELRLEGRPGDRVTSGFAVENHFDRPLEVAFESGDLIPGSGASLPGSLVTFEPDKLRIAPRGEAVVQAAVTITPDFIVGQTYAATIRLLGFQPKEVGFSLTILPPHEAAKHSDPLLKETKSADKRRKRSSR
ncbi:MAG: hypothetical protein ACRDQ2_07610 [Gaiellales bacterium]